MVAFNKKRKKSKFVKASIKSTGNIRVEKINGKRFIVLPSVIIREGIMNDRYYSRELLSISPNQWNYRPVTYYHPPEDEDSALSPEMIKSISIGYTFNTRFKGKSLGTEIWLDEDRTNEIDDELIPFILAGGKVDVSSGMEVYGEFRKHSKFKGKKFVVDLMFSDHVAMLKNEVGACSWGDGCGANRELVNNKKVSKSKKKRNNQIMKKKNKKKNKKKKKYTSKNCEGGCICGGGSKPNKSSKKKSKNKTKKKKKKDGFAEFTEADVDKIVNARIAKNEKEAKAKLDAKERKKLIKFISKNDDQFSKKDLEDTGTKALRKMAGVFNNGFQVIDSQVDVNDDDSKSEKVVLSTFDDLTETEKAG